MNHDIVSFFLRLLVVVCVWLLVWGLIEPRTQVRRVLRSGLLVLGLLGILVALKTAGG
jgi:hypothetical protein